MKSCLFNFYFKKGNFMVKVNSSSNNLYVEKKDNGEICVFGNEINYFLEFPTNFSAKDFDLFFTICHYAKKVKNNKKIISIDFDDMARFLDYKKSFKNKSRFYDEIFDCCVRCSSIVNKIISKNDNADKVEPKHFFKSITSDKDNKKVLFQLNEIAFDYLYFFENYFKLNLREFCSLRTKGAKILLRLLVQFNNLPKSKNGLKELVLNIDEFRKILKNNALDSYEPKYLKSRVLNPAIKELVDDNCYFKAIYCELLKEKKAISSCRISFDDSNRA